jgi:hypothetical protein
VRVKIVYVTYLSSNRLGKFGWFFSGGFSRERLIITHPIILVLHIEVLFIAGEFFAVVVTREKGIQRSTPTRVDGCR